MFKYLTYFFCLFSIGLTACDEARVFEENHELDNKIWLSDSIIDFQFDIKNSKKNYNIYYNIRNTVSYPYRNIYVNYSLEDTSGTKLRANLVNTDLFNPKTGRPLGSGLGDVFDHQVLLLENYKFRSAGVYNFKIQQYMRRDSLLDILAVGVRVEENLAQE